MSYLRLTLAAPAARPLSARRCALASTVVSTLLLSSATLHAQLASPVALLRVSAPAAPAPDRFNLPDAPTPVAALPEPAESSSTPTEDPAQTPTQTPPQTPTQTPAPSTGAPPPFAEQQAQADQSATAGGAHQTKRILGIMPNFRSVSADQQLPPETFKDKFISAGHDSFDYSSFIIAAVQSSISFASESYPEFHQGAKGFARYYWHTLADTADENFMVGGAFPAIFHQDNRFYTLGHGSVQHRAFYAFTRTLVTRGDSGNPQPNFSEIIGAGAASGLSSTYYPEAYRTWTKVGQKWLTGVIIDGANFTFKEFWPDINKHAFHNRD